jgi:hypothetical protein
VAYCQTKIQSPFLLNHTMNKQLAYQNCLLVHVAAILECNRAPLKGHGKIWLALPLNDPTAESQKEIKAMLDASMLRTVNEDRFSDKD